MGCLTANVKGTVASFINPTVTDIESARVYFSPTQLGEGTPSPDNVREIVGRTGVTAYQCGKNLLDPNIFTNTGYIGGDGAIVNSYNFKYCDSFILKKGNYIFTGINGNSGASNVRIHLYDKNGWVEQISAQSKNYNTSYNIPFEITDNVSYIRLSVPKNLINGQLELGSTAMPYEPYQGTTIPFSWKRLPDDYQEVEYIESDGGQYIDLPFGFDDTDEIAINMSIDKSSARDSYIVAPISWNTNKNRFGIGVYVYYTFAFGNVATNGTQLIPNIANDGLLHTWTYKNRYVSMNNGCSFDCTSITFGGTTENLRLFYGYNSNTLGKIAYYKHKKANGSEYEFIPCYRKSDNEIGMYDTVSQTFYTNQGTGTFLKGDDVFSDEVYGGYVDLAKGEIVEEYKYLRLDANTPCSEFKIMNSGLYTVWYHINDMASGGIQTFYNDSNIICNSIKKVLSRGSIPTTQLGILFGNNSNNIYLYNMNSVYGYTTIEEVSAWLDENPIYVTLPLADPIIHQLTPQQLQTLKNENNIWSDGDSVEVDYDLAETFDIQKAKRKIIMSQPHVESASNSPSSPQVIKFKTDMKAPLKQCIVNFAPIQEGSGDPSPTNIRPIKGWNGITLKHTGINMLQCSSPSYYIDATQDGITSQSSRNADNEIIGIDFNGTTTSTNIFRNLNYNPSDSGAVTMPRGLMGLTGYSDQVYVVPMGNGNALRTTDGRYWTGANTNSENGWNVWSVDSSETYNGLWVRTQVFPKETNVNVDTTVYPMMCLAEDVGCEFESYKGETFDVDWTDDAGTVYGGYIDLTNGQLVAEWIERMINSFDWSYNSSGECFRAFANIKRKSVNAISPIRSKIYKTTNVYNSISYWLNVDDFSISEHIGTSSQGELINSIHIKDSRYTTVSDFLNGVGNESIIYELAEPIHYSLTPQQIITFKGQNNIWANTNKLTEIKYWNHKKSDSTGVIYEAENLSFDGTNYIDTGVYLFSEENINRDFEVVIEDLYGSTSSDKTIICAKYNSTAVGFLIRLIGFNNITYNGTIFMKANNHNNIIIKRINGVITIDGEVITNPTVKFTNTVHNHPLVLGCALDDDGTPYRYATGTIGHITVKWL